MLARISGAEITAWMAYEQVTGPLGTERGDALAAVISATIASALSRRSFRPDDFIPKWDRAPEREQGWQEQLAIVTRLNRHYGGVVRAGESYG